MDSFANGSRLSFFLVDIDNLKMAEQNLAGRVYVKCVSLPISCVLIRENDSCAAAIYLKERKKVSSL